MPLDQTEGARIGATTDIRFTVLCFTSGTGDPVMCAILLKSSLPVEKLPSTWKTGIDIRKNAKSGKTQYELIRNNSGHDLPMSGGPSCFFNGKSIPCFIGTSPNASITSELLVSMLRTMDEYEVFDRSNGTLPFLLLDGHQSRIQLPFLNYINNKQHKWIVCIGVPYATHIWQVHDASEMNGVFKNLLAKVKREYLNHCNTPNFCSTDVIPLVKTAFSQSFAMKERAIKAIRDRGWGPLNYALLEHKEILKTKVTVTASTSETNTTTPSLNLTTLNFDGPRFGDHSERLLSYKLKADGSSKAHLKKKGNK